MIRASLREIISPADRQAWAAARTLDDLGQLTARWLEGTVGSQPGYQAGWGPDPETGPLVPVLACCNRAGYLTSGSQPGGAGPGSDGASWDQRTAVEGFAAPAVAGRICAAAGAAGLTVIAYAPATLPRYRLRYGQAVPVTRREERPCTWFGAQRPRRHLRDSWTGYGICDRAAIGALCAAWQVTVLDPQWGRNDRLWPVLLDALAAPRMDTMTVELMFRNLLFGGQPGSGKTFAMRPVPTAHPLRRDPRIPRRNP